MSESEYALKEETTLPASLSLPPYVPLLREHEREFDLQFRRDSTAVIFQQQLKQVQDMADHYIRYILSNPHLDFSESVLEKYLVSLEDLTKAERETRKLEQVRDLPNIQEAMSAQRRELNLASLLEFQKMDAPQLPDVIRQEFDSLVLTSPATNQAYSKFLKDALFVIKHPEETIPDENADDDDELNISGGKVSLKDAITLNYYEKPVRSNSCGHTYEESSIRAHLATKNTCPISGCNVMISPSSLKPDKLMLMRIRAATRMERHNNRNLETVV
ncbi:E3 SUMO-protein ligase MMS21 [Candida viswanathii]|uniref:E3 SUMO-protein ligase MMS21 n=1 Tax=Candida viswanathii TaxID=5486 RepID=A0A367XY01_9ASCO|nr:E3 SUMO-protein ligase MMS21 [Candida viswanathii]